MSEFLRQNPGFILFPTLTLIYVVYRLVQIRRHGFNALRELLLLALAFYMMKLAQIAIGELYFHWPAMSWRSVNLEPFKTISGFFEHRDVVTDYSFNTNIIGNAFLFFPFSLLAPIVFKRFRNVFKLFLFGLVLSLTIELVQLIVGGHAFDVDDLILNTISVLPGYLLFKLLGVFAWFRGWLVRAGDEGETTFWSFYRGWVGAYLVVLAAVLIYIEYI